MSKSNYIFLGFTLFALFFGAGNLIFPAELGQYSGGNLYFAVLGFAITGVGLPLFGILAIEFSNSNKANLGLGLFIFTVVFFGVTLWLSLNPVKLVDRIGKILAPALVILLAILLITVFLIQ